jgi:hypothetical protein
LGVSTPQHHLCPEFDHYFHFDLQILVQLLAQVMYSTPSVSLQLEMLFVYP